MDLITALGKFDPDRIVFPVGEVVFRQFLAKPPCLDRSPKDTERLSEGVPVYAAPDQDGCRVDM